jgi:FixJ family two-component response regulator
MSSRLRSKLNATQRSREILRLPRDESELFRYKRIVEVRFESSSLTLGCSRMSHIALVDDDHSVRRALARLLSAYGMEVRTYASLGEFLEALADGIPSCIIVDFHMPDRTGADLQREPLRRDIKVPTIVLTARDSALQREQCRSLGAAAFLAKPVVPQDLIGAINCAVAAR